jgi:multiple sugar transport system substrate-binding protein
MSTPNRSADDQKGGVQLNRRRLLQGTAGLGLAAAAPAIIRSRPAAAQDQVTVVYKTHEHPPAVAFNKTLIAEFEEQNPDIKIDYEAVPYVNFEQGLFTSFAGGEGWDLFWAGDWLTPQFFENDILAPVDPAAYGVGSVDEYVALYDKGALDAFMDDEGNVYAGGISEYNTFSLLFNPDHFTEAGLEPLSTTEPATWEQILEYGPKLAKTDSSGAKIRNALEWAFDANVWTPLIAEPMVRQVGGELVDPQSGDPLFTSDQVVKTFDYFRQLGETGSVDPALLTLIADDFAQDRASMIIGGPWAMPAVRATNPEANIAVAPLPVWEGGERVTTLYSWAWLVGNQSSPEVQAAAWKFLAYITSQGKRWWDEVGFIQPRNAMQEGIEDLAAYRNESEPLLAPFNDDYAHGRYMFRSTRFYEFADALLRVQSLVFEGEDAEQALSDEQSELEI